MIQTIKDSASPMISDNGRQMFIINPSPGSIVVCDHCNNPVFSIIDDCLVTIDRHHGQHHKTVISLKSLGYVRVA